MGLLICRLLCCGNKKNCRDSRRVQQNSNSNSNTTTATIAATQEQQQQRYKVLLLGATGAGKTQVGHYLSGLKRDANDHDATNGVRYFRVSGHNIAWNNGHELALSEIGGSVDMQRLWSHYYASTLGFIFCFDLSASATKLCDAFALLEYNVLAHAAVRGKYVLLVATHAHASNCEGLQLYDVENTFDLEMLARRYNCALRLCYFDLSATDAPYTGDLWHGIDWLLNQLLRHERILARRIKYDSNMQIWEQTHRQLLLASGRLSRVRRQRFRRHRRLWPLHSALSTLSNTNRPRTAPAASIFSITGSTSIGSTSGSSGAQSETINPVQKIV